MQMWIKKLLLILLLCSVCQAANDFSNDVNCVALYRFEDGALTTDTIGSNTLTNSNATVYTVAAKEGAGCVDLYSSFETDYMYRADAGLDSGFPGKSGGTIASFSLCYWVWIGSAPEEGSYETFASKWYVSGSAKTWWTGVNTTSGDMSFKLLSGYNSGASTEIISHGTTAVIHSWYHVGITWVQSTKAWKMRIWDDTAGALLGGAEATGTATNEMSADSAPIIFGNINDLTYESECYLDEFVVFKDELSSAEIDQIRAGTYAVAAPPASGGQVIMIQEF